MIVKIKNFKTLYNEYKNKKSGPETNVDYPTTEQQTTTRNTTITTINN